MSKVRHQDHNGLLNGSHWLSLSSSAFVPGLQIDDVQEQDTASADKLAAAAAKVPTSSLVPNPSEGSALKSGIATAREARDAVLSPTDIDAVLNIRLLHGLVLFSGFDACDFLTAMHELILE